VSLSGLNTDQDALRGLNLRSPLTTRSQQRRQSSLARQHGNSLSEGSAPTMNDVRSTKSTAILPISPQSPKMPARKVASAESLATSHNQQINNRRSKPRTSLVDAVKLYKIQNSKRKQASVGSTLTRTFVSNMYTHFLLSTLYSLKISIYKGK
jgi:hypothetical protein